MQILAHRGLWSRPEDNNSMGALVSAVHAGFGVETDVRDYRGEIVVAHDIPSGSSFTLRDFLLEVNKDAPKQPSTLALNIKSDGLANSVFEIMQDFASCNFFVFDMSIPDSLSYLKLGMDVFLRLSEFESVNPLFDQAAGVWLDDFGNNKVTCEEVKALSSAYSNVAVVSPELHRRSHHDCWAELKLSSNLDGVLLCTDFPHEAATYFGDFI